MAAPIAAINSRAATAVIPFLGGPETSIYHSTVPASSDGGTVDYEIENPELLPPYGQERRTTFRPTFHLASGLHYIFSGQPLTVANDVTGATALGLPNGKNPVYGGFVNDTLRALGGISANLYPCNYFWYKLFQRNSYHLGGDQIIDQPDMGWLIPYSQLHEHREEALGQDALLGRNIDSVALDAPYENPSEQRKLLFREPWEVSVSAKYFYYFCRHYHLALRGFGLNQTDLQHSFSFRRLSELFLFDDVAYLKLQNGLAGLLPPDVPIVIPDLSPSDLNNRGINLPMDPTVRTVWEVEEFTASALEYFKTELASVPSFAGVQATNGLVQQIQNFREHLVEDFPGNVLKHDIVIKGITGAVEYFMVTWHPLDNESGLPLPSVRVPTVGTPWHDREWESQQHIPHFYPEDYEWTVNNAPITGRRKYYRHRHEEIPKRFPFSVHGYNLLVLGQNKFPSGGGKYNMGHIGIDSYNNVSKLTFYWKKTPNQIINEMNDVKTSDSTIDDDVAIRRTTEKIRYRVWAVRSELVKYIPTTGDQYKIGNPMYQLTIGAGLTQDPHK